MKVEEEWKEKNTLSLSKPVKAQSRPMFYVGEASNMWF